MNRRSANVTILFMVACVFGCTYSADQPVSSKGNTSTSSTANSTMLSIKAIEGAPQATEPLVSQFERANQCQLPEDYRKFLLENNGGFPSSDCVTFQEDGKATASNVFCFHGVGDLPPWASIQWHIDTFSGRLPEDTLPIAHDSCGNLWLLNIGSQNSGTVVFWDHGTYDNFDETDFEAWPKVAVSFTELVSKLHDYQPLPEEEELLSRYVLVQQAIEGMAQRSPDFDKYAAVDAAWHCDFTEEGKIQMQLVNYIPHAAVTHTDGYSRLRAAKGLIDEGPPRLP